MQQTRDKFSNLYVYQFRRNIHRIVFLSPAVQLPLPYSSFLIGSCIQTFISHVFHESRAHVRIRCLHSEFHKFAMKVFAIRAIRCEFCISCLKANCFAGGAQFLHHLTSDVTVASGKFILPELYYDILYIVHTLQRMYTCPARHQHSQSASSVLKVYSFCELLHQKMSKTFCI